MGEGRMRVKSHPHPLPFSLRAKGEIGSQWLLKSLALGERDLG